MTPAKDSPLDPEDPLARLAAESTNEATPSKSLYGDEQTKSTPTRRKAVPPAPAKPAHPEKKK